MNTLILTKARISSSGLFSKSYISDLKKRDQLWILPLAFAGILAGLIFFLFMLIQNYRAILIMGINTRQPEILMFISGIFSSVLLLFIGTPISLSNIFYSKDNRLIVPLPVSTAEIAASRIITVYLFVLPIHLLINIPAVVLYFSAVEGSISAVGAAISLCLLGPLLPLSLALLSSAALAKAADLSGHRTAFEIAGMGMAIVLLGALQLSFGRSIMGGGDFSRIAKILNDYLIPVRKVLFISDWTASGFVTGGWLYALAGAVSSIAAAAAALLLLKKAVRLNLTDRPENKKRRKSPATKERQIAKHLYRSSAPVKALLRREWSIISSNSTFLFEVSGEVIVLPIMLLVFYFAIPGDFFSTFSEITASLTVLPLLAFGALILFSSINSVSSTSLSREGSMFRLSKALPVSGSMQIKSKLIFHLILFLSSWYLNLIILMVILKLPPIHLLYLIPGGPAVIILIFITNIHIDLSRPVLNWTHPQQAMKQNMNVLIGMGLSILSAGALAAAAAVLYLSGLGILFIGIIVTIIAAAADFMLIGKLFNYADRRYGEINP
ncbi:MAG: hypothetical protein JEZ04_06195 [Spirochaetales bacterium]|nr:hypothetical protein [Spirochaetales bacterium]